MRMLKQAVLTMALLVLALIALNLVRLGRAPAQVPPQGAAGNGDVNCDGDIDISDPIALLNWLFSDGPEPCAIAQTEPCCTELEEEVAMLRATVDALSARVASPKDIVLINTPPISGTQTVFTVPEDKWFVATMLLWDNGSTGPILRKVVDGQSTDIPVGQLLQNREFTSQIWVSGAAFPPGSRVDVVTPFIPADPRPFRLNGHLVGE